MKSVLETLLGQALAAFATDQGKPAPPVAFTVEPPKSEAHGDAATNIALVAAKPLGLPPRKVAEGIVANLGTDPRIQRAEIAGPGFINLFLTDAVWQQTVAEVLAAGPAYGHDTTGSKGRVLVEFVSANPTGPMHVGHGRGAAYGDALARMLAVAGWQVGREYYVNDAGRQVDVLGVSVWLRYLALAPDAGPQVTFPTRGYPGAYVVDTAKKLYAEFGDRFMHAFPADKAAIPDEPGALDAADGAGGAGAAGDDEKAAEARKAAQERRLDALIAAAAASLGAEDWRQVRDFAIADQLAVIKATLVDFGVRFDSWASERDVVEGGAAGRALARLKAAGRVYEKDGATWLATEALGDTKDRVLYKADGAATYFANDLAYHELKLERGFTRLIDVWGADHHGYVARVRAAIEALTGRPDALDVKLVQFVSLSSGRMGKRSGNFVTLADLIKEAGADATRFFYLLRGQDQHLEFDLDLARAETTDNPVYYAQMAHARVFGALRQAEARGLSTGAGERLDLAPLAAPEEKALAGWLARFPEVLEAAARHAAPHQLAHFALGLADALHRDYHAHHWLVEDPMLRHARLGLARAAALVIANCLNLLGVSAPERMDERVVPSPPETTV